MMSTRIASRSLECWSGVGAFALIVMMMLVIGVGRAAADNETAWWRLTSGTRPTDLKPGGEATLYVRAANLGEAGVSSRVLPVKITDKLPEGLEAVSAYGFAGSVYFGENPKRGEIECPVLGSVVTCEWSRESLLEPYEQLQIYIRVKATSPPKGSNTATVTGGEPYRCVPAPRFREGNSSGPFCLPYEETEPGRGAFQGEATNIEVPSASLTRPLTTSPGETQFGLADFSALAEGENGQPDTQAGSNPLQFTTNFALNETESETRPPAFASDLQIKLPAGLVGDAQAVPKCSSAVFAEIGEGNVGRCPNSTAVGVAIVNAYVSSSSVKGLVSKSVPVFNLPAGEGEPARFGFQAEKVVVIIDTAVRNGADYGVVTKVSGLTEFAQLYSSTVTIWGTPGAAEHRLSRGWSCVGGGTFWTLFENDHVLSECTGTGESQPHPLLRMPTSCEGPLAYSGEISSWVEPDHYLAYKPTEFGHEASSMTGCNLVPFASTFSVTPSTQTASSPAAIAVKLHVSQETATSPGGIAPSDVRGTTVTFPEGFTVNAASAGGLEGCSVGQIGYEAEQSTAQQQIFTASQPSCPSGSKLGTVTIKSPILEHPLLGSIYLAAPQNTAEEPLQNPFRSLVALYIVAEEPVSGVLVKLPGKISLDETTGRLTATFENTPQDPVEDLEVQFFGGPRAAIATPTHCGTYQIEATATPWSGQAAAVSVTGAVINSGPNGGACPSEKLPFAPSLVAGTVNNQAGGTSPINVNLSREDGNQSIESMSLHLPVGLTALISSVTPCPEAQASAGTCGAASLIGHSTVQVGVGSEPYTVTGGQVFLTGPYQGAPFGLSIVTPAKAGPFNLGTINVRATLQIDPHTAAVTVTTGAIPHILRGIPVQIRDIDVSVDRSGFALNPTNCAPLAFSGSVSSVEGGSAAVASPFEAANCSTLPFAPKFSARIDAQASKPKGMSLVTRLTYPAAPVGAEANISRAKVVLPIQFSTRQATLKKACLATTFDANPSLCPPGSIVGHGTAVTPLLPVPLVGPAYLVSYGGEAFPAIVVMLQGDNVTYDLVGNTLIRKGITSSSFKTVADVPVSSFELTLPAGEHSIFTSNLPTKANRNFCGQKLTIPTAFVGQSGKEEHLNTPVAVSGCKKAKPKKAKPKKKAKRTTKKK